MAAERLFDVLRHKLSPHVSELVRLGLISGNVLFYSGNSLDAEKIMGDMYPGQSGVEYDVAIFDLVPQGAMDAVMCSVLNMIGARMADGGIIYVRMPDKDGRGLETVNGFAGRDNVRQVTVVSE